MKPTLYLEDGTKVIPTKEKPVMFAVSSLNTGWDDYSWRRYYFVDNKDMFKEFYGKSGVYEEYLNEELNKLKDEYKKLYNKDLEINPENGLTEHDMEWWGKLVAVEAAYTKDQEDYKKDNYKKVKDYMINKYGPDVHKWPSTYREIVYKIHNGSFIKVNESFVDKHDDGIYADKVLDDIDDGTPGWDNQESPWKYMGAGIVKVTEEDFYLEFGATVPFAQLFGLNTAIVDESIVVKPKLELVTTPNPTPPTKPVEPKDPWLREPTQPLEPEQPELKEPTPPVKPIINEPKAPIPPVKPIINEPKVPTPPGEKPKVVEKIKREKPKEPEYKGTKPPTPQTKTLPANATETVTIEAPNRDLPIPTNKQTLPKTGSATDLSIVGLFSMVIGMFGLTKRKKQ